MRARPVLIVAGAFALGLGATAFAQNPQTPLAPGPEVTTPSPRDNQLACPPGVDERTAPSVGGDTTGSSGNLSRQLSESEGVVCPPAGVDPGMVEQPPSSGTLRVIPPPGSPGGDQSITPK
jgi:hypothetical protein